MIQRHSSRRSRLDQAVLNQRLDSAVFYGCIAGYFRSSLFEVAGEAINNVQGPVQIICNSDLDPQDLAVAAAGQTKWDLWQAMQKPLPAVAPFRRAA